MFDILEKINARPKPFEFYTADELWTDDHTSEQMLSFHLNKDIDVSSRNAKFIDNSVEWIVSHFNLSAGSKVTDFGCGPGLYASRLARKGASVTGVDFSKRSIKYAQETAKKEGLAINYINQNYFDFETDDKFDLVMMIMCDFSVLSPSQRKTMLSKFRSILKPGGSVLLDFHTVNYFNSRSEEASYEINQLYSFWSPDKYYGFVNTFKYDDEKLLLDKYTIIEKERTRTIYNWVQCYTKEAIEEVFIDAGFVVNEFLSDVAGTPYNPAANEAALIARVK